MKETSTPTSKPSALAATQAAGPRRSTLHLLRAFARIYAADARLGASLGGYVLN